MERGCSTKELGSEILGTFLP